MGNIIVSILVNTIPGSILLILGYIFTKWTVNNYQKLKDKKDSKDKLIQLHSEFTRRIFKVIQAWNESIDDLINENDFIIPNKLENAIIEYMVSSNLLFAKMMNNFPNLETLLFFNDLNQKIKIISKIFQKFLDSNKLPVEEERKYLIDAFLFITQKIPELLNLILNL